MGGGLESISHVLAEDARRERVRILGESRAKAAAMLREAEERAESKKKEVLAQAKREAVAFRENELAKARMDAKVSLLNRKDGLADKAFGAALERMVASKGKKEYSRLVSAMLCKTALAGDGELMVSGEDAKLFSGGLLAEINSKLGKRGASITLSAERRNIRGGFILSYPDRGIELNRSFESLLAESRERNMPKVARMLFEGAE